MTDETSNAAGDRPADLPHDSAAEPVTGIAPSADMVPARDWSAPLLIAVVVLGLIVVVGGIVLWRSGSAANDQVAQLQGQLAALQGRVDKVEARPVPVPPPPPPPPPDLGPLEHRLTALEQKPPPQAQLDNAGQQQIADVSSRIDGVAARQNQLGTTEQADVAKLDGRINDLTTQMAAVTKAGSAIASLADRQARTARLQMANVALQSGKPLGEIPSAPPALAQFATKPPPTEASLRLSFDAAAEAAHEAGQPPKETTPFLSRVWDRAQSALTIREGDRIIVGDPVSGVLGHARHLLDAGDLPGAVTALDGLAGPAAAAMAPWRAQAQSLLDARAALITAANG